MGRLSQLRSTVSLLLLLCSATLQADSFFDKFIDPTDGKFDTSGWLIEYKGLLPVPIIITEPAVGPGLVLQAGLDVAKGPEYTVFYLTVGSAWR